MRLEVAPAPPHALYARGEVCAKIQRSTKRFAWTTLTDLAWNSFCQYFSFIVPSGLMWAMEPYLRYRLLLPSAESAHRKDSGSGIPGCSEPQYQRLRPTFCLYPTHEVANVLYASFRNLLNWCRVVIGLLFIDGSIISVC